MKEIQHNTEIRELLQSYVKNTFHFSKNDPLASVYANGILELPTQPSLLDSSWEKLIRSIKNIQKEFGINPVCIAQGIISLTWKESDYAIPILLQEVKIQVNKLSKELTLENIDEPYLNPFLAWFFEREFDVELSSSVDEIQNQLSTYSSVRIDADKQFIGNFHPHRFEMFREIEQLIHAQSYSLGLKQIMGLSEGENCIELPLSGRELVSSDPDQTEVFTKLQGTNCVVQGPPGTGKSQVIVNVLGKMLEMEKSTLVVSEKRVALDVIQKKLSSLGLGGLCYTSTKHFSNTNFIHELKKEWQRLELIELQKKEFSPIGNLVQSQLQNTLNLLNQPKLGNGKTILEFLIEYEQDTKNEHPSGYSSALPALDEWKSLRTSLEFLFEKDFHFLISQIKTELIDKAFFLSIENKIPLWKRSLTELSSANDKLEFQQLYELARKSVFISKFNTVIFRKYGIKFLGNTSISLKLVKLKNDFLTLKIEIEKSDLENAHWIHSPNNAEVVELCKRFENASLFTALSRKKLWKKWTRSPFLDPLISLNLRRKQLEIRDKLQTIEGKLVKLGIDNIHDLEEIVLLNTYITSEEITEYQQLSEHERSSLEEQQGIVSALISDFKLYFCFDDSTDLVSYFNALEKILFVFLENVGTVLQSSKFLSVLTKKFNHVLEIESAIMHSTWSKLKMDFPQLIDFSWTTFYQKINELNSLCDKEQVEFAKHILSKQKHQFDEFHSLLLEPTQKLSSSDKELKQELKAGKRILVKEFAKSKNHLSMRQLMDSPAKKWIHLLKPVWLMNPSRISACFPLEQHVFSLTIFDEASQIPLENAFGALQRSERVLIAGDPQQMSPSSYFTRTTESVDLLHQASFYLPSIFLSYHYRSYHPELISFSNTHFYQNRLAAFRDASFTDKPIQSKYVPEGRFDERTNVIEAKAVADYITDKLSSIDSLGIVAFSESQLQEIYDLLPSRTKEILQERVEADQLFFKSVENVQGDECDELIVSFGYGYAEKDGVFAHRFGPINLTTGAKRLNVLFTRARKKITFFASVKYDDFKPSSNESIEILRKWFRKMDDLDGNSDSANCKIHVKDILRNQQNILAIKTLISVYQKRNWLLEIE
jgi:hypothetical protein